MADKLQLLYDHAPTMVGSYDRPCNYLGGIEQTLNEVHRALDGLYRLKIAELEEEEQNRQRKKEEE